MSHFSATLIMFGFWGALWRSLKTCFFGRDISPEYLVSLRGSLPTVDAEKLTYTKKSGGGGIHFLVRGQLLTASLTLDQLDHGALPPWPKLAWSFLKKGNFLSLQL